MKRLLIVSPHFPPTDAVDMHRVRTSLRSYRDHGWEPVVLAVRPECAGRIQDPGLLDSVPEDVEIVRVGAFPQRLSSRIGVTAVGLRGWSSLKRAGAGIIGRGGVDLVFFSTTQFVVLTLGPVWKRRCGIPFVLDIQDPWYPGRSAAGRSRRRGAKHAVMRELHRRAERATVPEAAGLMATSRDYLDELTERYPDIALRPRREIPFGFDPADWPENVQSVPDSHGMVYLGAVNESMAPALGILFAALRAGREQRLAGFPDMRLTFVGTSYGTADNSSLIRDSADRAGVGSQVSVEPARVPFREAQRRAAAAAGLILLSQKDGSYRPSKLAGLLHSCRPVIACGFDGPVASTLDGLPGVALLRGGDALADAREWSRAIHSSADERTIHRQVARRWSAAALTAVQCELFDESLRTPA